MPAVAQRAIALSGLKGISAGELLGSVGVAPQSDTSILTFTVTNGDPRSPLCLATAYAKAFTSYRGQLDSDAVRRARAEIAQRLDTLTADGQDGTKLATSLRDKDQQLATLQALQTSRTYVIRTADGAGQIAPTPKKNAMLGLILGIVLGLGLAFLVDALDTRVRSANEVGAAARAGPARPDPAAAEEPRQGRPRSCSRSPREPTQRRSECSAPTSSSPPSRVTTCGRS